MLHRARGKGEGTGQDKSLPPRVTGCEPEDVRDSDDALGLDPVEDGLADLDVAEPGRDLLGDGHGLAAGQARERRQRRVGLDDDVVGLGELEKRQRRQRVVGVVPDLRGWAGRRVVSEGRGSSRESEGGAHLVDGRLDLGEREQLGQVRHFIVGDTDLGQEEGRCSSARGTRCRERSGARRTHRLGEALLLERLELGPDLGDAAAGDGVGGEVDQVEIWTGAEEKGGLSVRTSGEGEGDDGRPHQRN